MMTKPLLSIGIIFKNEIRSLERCLKALTPLRETIPCELLMADTGSTDGCREIAEKYADRIIDFPWIDDFSAARNAVIEQAQGEWYLVVDDDEYLDEDFSQLTAFLNSDIPDNLCYVVITQRNYFTYEMDRAYNDFLTPRLLRMSAGIRYQGAIHEALTVTPDMYSAILPKIVLNHDGYAALGNNSEAGKKKRERNITALRKELKKDPDDLRRLMQYIESGSMEADYVKQIYRAVKLVERKSPGWEYHGAPLMRYGVTVAQARKLPELEKWIKEAYKLFPDSYFTRIDVRYISVIDSFGREDYAECIRRSEGLFNAYEDFRAGRGRIQEQMVSNISMLPSIHEESMKVLLAKCYLEEGEPERAREYLEWVDCTVLEEQETLNLSKCLLELHGKSEVDTAALVRQCWMGINEPIPHAERAEQRRDLFLQAAAAAFSQSYRKQEEEKELYRRPAYTALLALADKCDVGRGAAMMAADSPAEIEALLRNVEKWNELPATALLHALRGIPAFPLPDKPLRLEEMDDMARRLSTDAEAVRAMALAQVEAGLSGSWQSLNWSRALVLAAVRSWGWKEGGAEKTMELARGFARLEHTFLPRYYSTEVLLEENIGALPPLHRFGWYFARAFEALDKGDPAAYARLLKNGLQANKGMKPMVEFLMENTAQLQEASEQNAVNGELEKLAGQVRSILANYSPDDPAVIQLKASPVYQKVAWMLEEPAATFGLPPQ